MGYVDPRTIGPVMELTCVMHRKDPVWVSIISQVTPSESSKIKAMGMSTLVRRYLNGKGFESVREVYMMEELVNLRPYVAVRMEKEDDDEPRRVMESVLQYGDRVGKFIVTVDEDINVSDPVAVTWAITHRCQPHRDVTIVPNRPFGATPIGMVVSHPSSRYDGADSALLIDATRKADLPPLSLPRKPYMDRAVELWRDLGLPELRLKEPWHGYLMGLWPEELDEEARPRGRGRLREGGREAQGNAGERGRGTDPQVHPSGVGQDPRRTVGMTVGRPRRSTMPRG